MPQNTPMKRQFTTIDGRTVMSNLPQHWGGNDWKVTGVDNPLPVGNYVQTEAGVWIPQKGSDDGAADVRLTGSNVELTTLVDAQALTTTVTQFIRIPVGLLEKYTDWDIVIYSTLDVDIRIAMQHSQGTSLTAFLKDGTLVNYDTNFVNQNTIQHILPAGGTRRRVHLSSMPFYRNGQVENEVYDPSFFKKYSYQGESNSIENLGFAYKATTTPTSGSITAILQGRLR